MPTQYTAPSAAAQQVFSMTNGAPFDFFEFFDLVVNSSANTTEKLLALITGRHIGRNSEPAFPSRTRVIQQASCSENTFQRSLAAMRLFFHVEQRRGRATLYHPKLITADDVETAIAGLRSGVPLQSTPQNGVHHKSGYQDGVPLKPSTPQNGATTTPQNGVAVPPKMGRHKEPLKEPIKKEPPFIPRERSNPDPFGLSKTISNIHRDCWFDEEGRIQVANGFRSELVAIAGTPDRLRIELDSALRYVQPHTSATILKSKVRGQIQHQVSEKRDRDARYEAAARRNARTVPQDDPVEKPAGMPQKVWEKLQADIAAKRSQC